MASAIPPTAGQPISLLQVKAELGGAFSNLGRVRGLFGQPATGRVALSSMYGKARTTPSGCGASHKTGPNR